MSEQKKLFTDAMIDIETVSTKTNARILSIGYCLFNIKTGELGDKGEIVVHTENDAYHICPRTLAWWGKQPKEAQNRVFDNPNVVPMDQGLMELTHVLVNRTIGMGYDQCRVWGNGPSFDMAKLAHAYDTEKLSGVPWHYGSERCVRTMVQMGRDMFGFDPKTDMPFEGVRHSAADDSEHQAKYVSAIYRKINREIESCKI